MQKYVHLVDLVKSFPKSIYLQKIGVDIAENEPLKVWGKIQLIIHSPPRSDLNPPRKLLQRVREGFGEVTAASQRKPAVPKSA